MHETIGNVNNVRASLSSLKSMGSGDNSFDTIGEPLSKEARHRLTLICLEGLRPEIRSMGLAKNSRGRPPSLEAILAAASASPRRPFTGGPTPMASRPTTQTQTILQG